MCDAARREGGREEGNRDEGGDGGKIELPLFAPARPSARPPVRSFVRSPFSGNAQERKLDYGNEAEKKFAGGAERKRIREDLDGLCEGAL